MRQTGKHDADQGAVWQEVHMSLTSAGAVSPTAALSDAYAKKQNEMTVFRQSLQLPSDAVGVAVFHGHAFQGLDLFDRHSTLKYFWESLLDSYAIELLGVSPAGGGGEPADDEKERRTVREALDRGAAAKWESYASPGEGTDWRLEDERLTGSSLVCEESVIHLQLFPKRPETEEQGAQSSRPRIHRRYGRRGASGE